METIVVYPFKYQNTLDKDCRGLTRLTIVLFKLAFEAVISSRFSVRPAMSARPSIPYSCSKIYYHAKVQSTFFLF